MLPDGHDGLSWRRQQPNVSARATPARASARFALTRRAGASSLTHPPTASTALEPTPLSTSSSGCLDNDGWDGDGDAGRDTNDSVAGHAQAFGARGARRAVEAAVRRSSDGAIERRSWQRVTEPDDWTT